METPAISSRAWATMPSSTSWTCCAGTARPRGAPTAPSKKTTLNSFTLTRDGRDGTTSPSQLIEIFASQAAMGIDQAIFSLRNVHDLEPFDVLANEVVPVVDKIAVAGR